MPTDAATLLHRMTTRARLRHMQALIVLDDLRSMSRAAAALGMTQPAVTQLVAEFEQLLEIALFLRHSRGVTPTAAAADLLPVARRIISAAEDGAEVIASHNRRDGGMVRIAATVAGSGALLHDTLPGFAAGRPGVQVQYECVVGQGLDASFAGDGYDIVCCRERQVVPEGWGFSPCVSDALVVLCAPDHPFAATRPAEPDLAAALWLQNHVSTIARQHFDAYADRAGWAAPRMVQVISRDPSMIWAMLRSAEVLALVPQSVVVPWIGDGRLVALDTLLSRPLSPVGIYWKPDRAGSATRALARAIADRAARSTALEGPPG